MKMSNTKEANGRIAASLARSVDFELTIADMARRSERRAWRVAWSAIAMALILAGGYFYMLPLKQKVPYLVMADAYTGTSTVARLAPSPDLQHLTASQAINRSNVAHYVLARESYDVTLMNLRDWNTVMTMSAPGVAAAYRALYAPGNESNPYKLYGKDSAIRTRILSIVLLGAQGKTPTGATVRFQRSLYNKSDGGSWPLDNKIATITFKYVPGLQMEDRYRLDNPLGFLVTDYRVDNDYDAIPPIAPPAVAAGGAEEPMASPNESGTLPTNMPNTAGTAPQTARSESPGAPAPATPLHTQNSHANGTSSP
jgi:type IV secretion system protein VirB8